MTPKELNDLLRDRVHEVATHLFPNGRARGHEFQVGSIAGEPGKSLSIRLNGLNAGVWKDFADADSGGDLLALWAGARNLTFVDTLAEVKEYLGVKDEVLERKTLTRHGKPTPPKTVPPASRMVKWFLSRGITEPTLKKLKIEEGTGKNSGAIFLPYLSPEGELELEKYRSFAGKKKFWSNSNPAPCLFGWQAISPDDREVVICEGEIDCASFLEQQIPALSVPKGAGGGGKQDWIEYEFLRLERFEMIYIAMDCDDSGDQARAEIIDRLGRHRCKVIDMSGTPHNDANDVHLAGEKLVDYLDSASTEDPEELRQLAEFHHEIIADLRCVPGSAPGHDLPWPKTVGEIRLRRGEVSVWGGINGHGKSLVVSNVIVGGVAQGEKWCVASMEMPPSDFGNKLYRQAGWHRGMTPGEEDQLALFTHDNVWLFHVYGTAKADKMLSVFHYAYKRFGIKNFVVDSLAKCGYGEDDYNGQKAFVDRLMEFALQHSVHVHLVCHVRKQGEEDKVPNKFSIKGTGAIADMVANVFIVWRNKPKEEQAQDEGVDLSSEPDMILDCVKQKKTGVEPRFLFWFDPGSCQFLEHPADPPKRYVC